MNVDLTETAQTVKPQELKDGLRILARIIAREFLKSQQQNGKHYGEKYDSGSVAEG
ncbi:MAG: hypothetical protein ACOY3K_00855 [Candidatus Omnitrophota bacterium]